MADEGRTLIAEIVIDLGDGIPHEVQQLLDVLAAAGVEIEVEVVPLGDSDNYDPSQKFPLSD